jgi:flagellar biosynthesis protein FlhA
VAQIPALLVSIAAGMVVTRVGDDNQDISQQAISQLFSNARVLYVTAGILGIMGLVPGMPHLSFLLLAGGLGALAYTLRQRAEAAPEAAPVRVVPAAAPEAQEASWADVAPVDVLGLEVGYRLIPLVDKAQDGELLRRIRGIRKRFAQEIGYLVPPVHIRDNLELKPNAYRILMKGVEIGAGEAMPGMFMAINPGRVAVQVQGTATKDPAFGLPAVWIDAGQKEVAQSYGYTVVDASTVVATHLNHLILSHAAELLGRQEAQQLLDHLGKEMPKLVEDLVPKTIALGTLQKVLQNLLEEGVHIRDMRTIVETVAEHAIRTQNADDLTAQVRVALGRSIVQQLYPGGSEMQVMSLDPNLERILVQAAAGQGSSASIEPGLAETLMRDTATAAQRQEDLGLPAVLLVQASIRPLLAKFLRRTVQQLKVLSHPEVPDNKMIKVTSVIGGNRT